MKIFAKFLFCLLVLFTMHYSLCTGAAYANNISVTNVSLYKAPGQPDGTIDIKFDVTWDNPYSGRDANNKLFFDRAWIFVKYWKSTWVSGTDPWAHATLAAGGTLSTYNSTTNTGISADGIGAFCAIGTNQTVRWNYSAAGLSSSDTITVKAFAVEMVYIPQGAFDLGDGNGASESTNAFHVTDNTGIGLISSTTRIGTALVSSIKVDVNSYDDDQIELTGIGIKGDGGIDSDNNGTIDNASFPTGYNAFYIMKYEISQGQYRDFLNTLTSTQASNRFPNSFNTYRHGITRSGTPYVYYCDLNNNGVYNETADGEWIACNYLTYMDVAAYVDWAGLRPMTELEFEKACRGPSAAVYQEWAGGAYAALDYFSDLSNSGASNEAKGATRPNANCNYSSATPDGPVRCGMFATSSSTRTQAGASYYGVMELSGNVWERPVTVGNSQGRSFTASNGDGSLNTLSSYQGNAVGNNDWPGIDGTTARGITGATGSGFRGGGWGLGTTYARVSDRNFAANTDSGRYSNYGGRGVRTSP